MGSGYDECPYCGREGPTEHMDGAYWFPLYECNDCEEVYCNDDGPPCPECESESYFTCGEVYGSE